MASNFDLGLSIRTPGMLPARANDRAVRLDLAQCGNPECSGAWLSLLKDKRRPIFERRWGCSRRCVEAIVLAALRRETGDSFAEEEARAHRHRMPLGLVLLSHGWVTRAQLQRALEMQRRAGTGRIGRWLTEECGVATDCVARGLAMQWGCPVIGIDGFQPEAMALAAPKVLIEALGMMPLRIAGRRILYLAFADQPDAAAAFAMERMSGLKVESGLANDLDLRMARERLCACEFVDAGFDQASDIRAMSIDMASKLRRFKPRASRLVRVHQFYWLRMWLEHGAMNSLDGGMPVSKEDVVDHVYELAAQRG